MCYLSELGLHSFQVNCLLYWTLDLYIYFHISLPSQTCETDALIIKSRFVMEGKIERGTERGMGEMREEKKKRYVGVIISFFSHYLCTLSSLALSLALSLPPRLSLLSSHSYFWPYSSPAISLSLSLSLSLFALISFISFFHTFFPREPLPSHSQEQASPTLRLY